MRTEEAVKGLQKLFGVTALRVTHSFGETAVEVDKGQLVESLSYLKNEGKFSVLMDLTGVDYLTPAEGTQVIYFLHNPDNLERIRIMVFVERDGTLPSVVSLWGGAGWYERELFDLFGVQFAGHPKLTRILLPDDWTGHPLRKDYKLTEEPVAFKHGVSPKVPSENIHVEKNQKYKQ